MARSDRLGELIAEYPLDWTVGTADKLPAAGHRCAAGAHSRLADGTLLCWAPQLADDERVAVDAEYRYQPVPHHLRRYRVDDFWTAWTSVEVCCKLLDVPVLAWLQRHGLQPDPAVARHVVNEGDITITFGHLTAATA